MQLETDVAHSGAIRVRFAPGDLEAAQQHRHHHLQRIAPIGSTDLSSSIPRPGCSLQRLHSLNSTVTSVGMEMSVGMEISASPRSGNAPGAAPAAAAPFANIDSGSAPGSAGSLQARTVSGTEASTASAAAHGLQRSGSGRTHSPVWPPVPEPDERSLHESVTSSGGATSRGTGMQHETRGVRATLANFVRHVSGGRSGSLHSTAPPGDGTGASENDSGGQLDAAAADSGGNSGSTRRKLQRIFGRSGKGSKGPAASNTTGAVAGSSNTGSKLRRVRLLRPGARTAPMTVAPDGNAPQPVPRIKKARGRRVTGGATARPPLWRGPGKKLIDAARRKANPPPPEAPPPQAAQLCVRVTPLPRRSVGEPAPPPRVGISQVFSEIASTSGHELPSSRPTPRGAAPHSGASTSTARSAVATQLARIVHGGVHDAGASDGAHSWPSDVSLGLSNSGATGAHTVALGGAQVNPNRGHHHHASHPPAAERPVTPGRQLHVRPGAAAPAQARTPESAAPRATPRSTAARSRETTPYGSAPSQRSAVARASPRPSTPTRQSPGTRAGSRPQTPRAGSRGERPSTRPRSTPFDANHGGPRAGASPARPVRAASPACPVQRTSSGRSDAFAPPDSPRSLIPSSPRSLLRRSAPVAEGPGTPRRATGDSATLSADDNALARRMRADEHRREQETKAQWVARSVALNNLPGMPKHLSARIWEDLEDPKFRYRDSRRKNEINNVLGAVLVYSRSASGHSGRIDGDDTSQSGSQVLDGPGAQSSGIGAPDDDDGDDTEACQLNLELRLPAKANCNFQRSDVIWKDAVAVGQGSSAIVFEAVARDSQGAHVNVVIKERRTRADRAEDRSERQMFKDELELCSKLTHRNIVFCHGGYIAPPDDPPGPPDFILFERCAASLSHYLACRYDEERPNQLWLREGLDVGLSILNALHWIHPDVTHGDLSTSNVLLATRYNKEAINTMHVMIADFETARVKHRGVMRHGTARGTPAFMPPLNAEAELLRRGYDEDWLHQNRDVYSTSMIMFHAITGCCPFVSCVDHSQVNRLANYNRNRYGSVLPLPEGLPEQLEQFFRDCWSHKLGTAMLARNRLLELKLGTPAVLLDAPCVPSESLRKYQAAYPAVCNPPLDSADLPPAAAAALARPQDDAHASVFDVVQHEEVFDLRGLSLPQHARGSELARNAALGSVAQRQEMMKISRGSASVVHGAAVNACILHAPESSDDDSVPLGAPRTSRRLSHVDSGGARRGGGLLNGSLAAPAAVPIEPVVCAAGGGIAAIFEGICGAVGLDEDTGRQPPPPEVRSRLPTPRRRSAANPR